MSSSSRVLITGATGAVGPLVVQAFHDNGYAVRTLSLDPPPAMWSDHVDARIGDVTDRSAVETAMQGVDSVVHLAALLHIINPQPGLQKEYERINVKGTETVVEAALRNNVRRLVFFSTIAVYGPSGGAILTEDSPTRPATLYARTKSAAETIVLSARKTDDDAALGTVLRLGAVYGARIKGNYQRLVNSLAQGRFIPLGPGLNRRTLIYDKDVAQAAILAAKNDAAAGKIFNVTDGGFHTLKDIIDALCNALGRSYPLLTLPVGPTRILAAGIEKGFTFAGLKPPITRETIDTYTEDIAVDGRRIQNELDFAPRYNLGEGWKDTIEDMRRMGTL